MTASPTQADFLRALHPDQTPGVTEVRILGDGMRPTVRFYRDIPSPSDITLLMKHFPKGNIYVGCAKRQGAEGGTKDNCSGIYVLWVDLDFKTTAENVCQKRLRDCPLPPSIIIRTGGGLHVYWMLNEPLDAAKDRGKAEALLRGLAAYCGGDAACCQVAQILRVPGTLNHKYDPAPLVTIDHLDPDRVYDVSDFEEWLPADTGETTAGRRPANGHKIPQGQRHAALLTRAGQLRRLGLDVDAIAAALRVENTTHCDPPKAESEIREIAAFVGTKEPADQRGERHLTLTSADQIAERPVKWIWQDRLPVGTVALLGGREGIGKSILGITLAAEVTRGTLPGIYQGTPRDVLIVATEDSWAHTTKPRLMAAGADLKRVHRVNVISAEGAEAALTIPLDVRALETAITEVRAGLVLLDPLLPRLDGALDTHKDAQVRQALEPLTRMADTANVCIIGLIHVNKSGSADPLTLLMGSRAFAAVARSVLFVMVDPDDDSRRLLGTPKNNLGRTDLPTLTFTIEGHRVSTTAEGEVWTGRLRWGAECQRSIWEAITASAQSSGDRTAAQEAADWLHDYLRSQSGVASKKDIEAAGKDAGHTVAAIRRGRERLKLRCENRGFPRQTYWRLPVVSPVASTARETDEADMTDTTGAQSSQLCQG